MRHGIKIVPLLLLLSLQANAAVEKTVGKEWVWFTDYAYLYSEWTFNVESGCHVEIAGGMKIGGKPRGSNYIVFGGTHRMITTWGVGAIHARTTTAFDSCRVRMDQGDVGSITVHSDPSLTSSPKADDTTGQVALGRHRICSQRTSGVQPSYSRADGILSAW